MDKNLYLQCGNFQVPHPMKYQSKPNATRIKQAFNSGDWFMTEKKDGAFFQLIKNAEGDIGLFSRTISRKNQEYVNKIDNVPHIKEWAEFLPNDTILVGEIYVPGGKSNDVTKIMGCTPKNAQTRQYKTDAYGGPLHYYVFDMLKWAGEDLCNVDAYYRVQRYINYECLDLFLDDPYVERVEIFEDNFEKHLSDIFSKGGEGSVFKRRDMKYEPGKRPATCFKYKEHLDSIDLVCIGVEDPEYYYTGKEAETWPYKDDDGNLITKAAYYGWKNALRLGAYKDDKLIEVGTVASGLTDAIREDLAKNPDDWIGSVIECEAMSTSGKAAFRHCVFIQKRNDKNPEECLYKDYF